MLKIPCLKRFVFFILLLSYSNLSYSNREHARRAALSELLADYDDRRSYGQEDVKAQTPIFDVIQKGIKVGTANALQRSALDVITTILKIIPYSVNKLIAMIKIYAYKGAFGTTGLTVKDLTKFSNRINGLCSPLASSQVGNLRKTKRATAIESEQNNGQYIDIVWLKRQSMLVSELEHVTEFLRKILPCYNAAFQSIDSTIVEKKLATILYALSTENNDEIQNYIIRLMGYIRELINLLESFNSFDNAIEHSDETKALLTIIRSTFEHISTFLADAHTKGSGSFQKTLEDTGTKNRDLMDLLGSGGYK